jgi:hypothetical protein
MSLQAGLGLQLFVAVLTSHPNHGPDIVQCGLCKLQNRKSSYLKHWSRLRQGAQKFVVLGGKELLAKTTKKVCFDGLSNRRGPQSTRNWK